MNGETKHTPGPWEISPADPCRVNVCSNVFLHPYEPRVATAAEAADEDEYFHDDWNICQANDDMFSRPEHECEANARLIAASPTAHELLGELAIWFDASNSPNPSALYDDRTWRQAVADYLARVAGPG